MPEISCVKNDNRKYIITIRQPLVGKKERILPQHTTAISRINFQPQIPYTAKEIFNLFYRGKVFPLPRGQTSRSPLAVKRFRAKNGIPVFTAKRRGREAGEETWVVCKHKRAGGEPTTLSHRSNDQGGLSAFYRREYKYRYLLPRDKALTDLQRYQERDEWLQTTRLFLYPDTELKISYGRNPEEVRQDQ